METQGILPQPAELQSLDPLSTGENNQEAAAAQEGEAQNAEQATQLESNEEELQNQKLFPLTYSTLRRIKKESLKFHGLSAIFRRESDTGAHSHSNTEHGT